MPNWKKVVTSGSNAELSALTMSGNIVPDTDNTLSIGASDNRFLLNGGTPVTVTGSGTANTVTRFQSATTVEDSKITSTDTLTSIQHTNNGNQIFVVSGSNGELLSVTDEVGDELLRVNDTSGIGVFIVSSSGTINAERLTASTEDFVLTYNSASGDIFFQSSSIIRNESGVISSSAQIADDISGSLSNTAIADLGARIASGAGDFVANEFIVAVGKNAITSSDALAVDSSGNLGIGTSSPEVRLHMSGDGAQTAQIRMEQFNDTTDAPDIRTRRARGTAASPSDVQTGDFLFRLNVEGRDDGSNVTYASQQFDVDSDDQDALNYKLETRDTGGTLARRYMIDGNGNHQFTGSLNLSGSLTADSATVDNFTINDTLTADTVTGSLLRLSEGGSGLRLTNVGGFEPQSGTFNIFGNNDVTFGAGGSGAGERVLTLVESNRHAQFEVAVSASVFSGSFVGDGSGLTGVTADGTLSSSAQIASDISGSLSATAIAALSAGIVSGSAQTVANLSNQDVDLGTGTLTATKIVSNVVSQSILLTTGSNIFGDEQVDTHEFTGSVTITGSLSATTISNVLSSSAQIASDVSGSLSNTAIAALEAGILSGSGQLPSGIVSGSAQTIANLPSGTVSGSAQTIANLPSGTVSGSAQTIANLPSGTISGSAQLPDGLISGSSQQPTIIVDRIEHIDDDNTAISFTPDQMYFSSSGIVGMTIGGAGGVTVNPDGVNSYNFTIKGENVDHLFSAPNYQADRIGMNTQYPSHLLHVSGTARTHTLIVDERIEHHDDSDTGIKFTPNQMFFSSSGVVGMTIGGAGGVIVNPDQTNSGHLTVRGETLSQLFTVGNGSYSDKIGINTQYPSHLLHVSGTARAASIVVDGEIMHHDDTGTRLSFTSSQMDFTQNNIHSLTLAGTVVVNPDRNNASDFNVLSQTSGETILNVDVGDTSITFHDSYKFPTADGTANQVLKTDGSGTLSFGDAGGDFTTLTNVPSGLVSGSAQIASDISVSITSTSSSIASDIATLVSFSSSLDTTIYDFTGSFTGDGSGLTGVESTVTEQVTVTDSFTSETTHSVAHTFGTKDLNVTVYDSNDDIFVPTRVNTPTTESVVIYMDPATTGRVVISKGGHLVSGSISTEIVTSSTVSDTFTSATTHSIAHTFGTKDVIVNVYDSNDDIFVPTRINTPTTSSVVLYMDPATSGRVVIGKSGHIVSGAADVDFSAISEHIVPSVADTYDLGTPDKPWRDLYLSEASLYIDGTQVISSTSDTLTFTTDTGQSIKLLEEGADDIILQTDTGNIELKGTVEILTGKKITDSAGSSVHFGDSISVTGSINVSGNVDGIDLQSFSSSVANSLNDNSLDLSAVSQSILPHTTEAFDLGSASKRWKDLYLSGSTIDLGGTKITRDATTGDVEFKDSGDNLKRLKVEELFIGSGASQRKLKVGASGRLEFSNTSDEKQEIDVPDGTVSSSAQIASDISGSLSATAIAGLGAGIVSGSAQISASAAASGFGSGGSSVTEAATYTANFTNASSASFSHNFGTKNVIVQTYFSGSDQLFFPDTITTTDNNTVDVTFNGATDGRVVIAKGGHMISSSLNDGNLPGITGSSFTNVSSVEVEHGFGTKEVVVSVYDNDDNLIMPSNIRTTTTSSVDVTFAQSRSGRVVVSKGGHVITSTTAEKALTAEGLTTAGNRQSIEYVTTAVTASLFTTHLLRGSVTMSLPSGTEGDWFKVSNRITSSYAHLNPAGSEKIMGVTGSLEIDTDNAGLEFIYTDSTDGWIIIGN